MQRREFLGKCMAAGLMSLAPLRVISQTNILSEAQFTPVSMSPLEILASLSGSSVIEGDEVSEAHEIFLDKEAYLRKKGGVPRASEDFDVVIIGGGISGLVSAYKLPGKRVLLLEGQTRLGGNSKSQRSGEETFSQGAAYTTVPDEGDVIDLFYRELGLKEKFRCTDDDAVYFGAKVIPGFWKGETDPARADEFARVTQRLKAIFENDYPDLPDFDSSPENMSRLLKWDKLSFQDWLNQEFPALHPHIQEFFHLYCWSSFGGVPSEISAAQALNFITSDLSGTQVLPGGNGFIAQKLFEVVSTRPLVKIRNHSFAVDVKAHNGKAVICYADDSGTLRTVRGDHCILAVPKLVSKVLISDLSPSQKQAMSDLEYRSYLVANVILKKSSPPEGFDLFSLNGSVPLSVFQESKARVFSDIVFAGWAEEQDSSVLTVYMPYPFEGAAQSLFAANLYERVSARLTQRLFQIGIFEIEGIRLVRYGHALPLAKVNALSSGSLKLASSSIGNCIHFANQDNWANPCFETAFMSAVRAVEKIR